MKFHLRYFWRGVLTLALLPLPALAEFAPPIHGAMALGYNWTQGNNYFGDSENEGASFSEFTVNSQAVIRPRLLASGQVNARRAGSGEPGTLRVDYAQLDYQIIAETRHDFGLRVGTVKNPYGFFNTTRDVVFSRPGITMPSSVYFDGNGYRDLFFSSDGAQLYGHFSLNDEPGEWTLGWVARYNANDEFGTALVGSTFPTDIEVSQFLTAQWLQDWAGGRFRTGLSYLRVGLDVEVDTGEETPFNSSIDADIYVVSAQWQLPTCLLTTELRYNDNSVSSRGENSTSSNDGGYLQLRWMPSAQLSFFGRYDVSYSDRDDRDGREYAADAEGRSRYSRFGHDGTLGMAWKPTNRWGVYAEYHYVYGTHNLPRADNLDETLDPHWQLLMVMLGYRF